jgi:kynurenine formamidase
MKLFLSESAYFDTSCPLDISIPVSDGDSVRAWYVSPPLMEPVRENGYVGSVREGGSVNFRSIHFNPHGHGTHTECLGHITPTIYSVNQVLKEFFFKAIVLTVTPRERYNETYSEMDWVIDAQMLESANWEEGVDALIIRTRPNTDGKLTKDYSSTNAPYLDVNCLEVLNKYGIKHLLVDLPSVDRENDGGKLAMHHQFWNVPESPNFERTLTEMVFVEDGIQDGVYILELQMAAMENDASPSRPVLYAIQKTKG